MFKKILAGLTVVALSLGMVALTAGPASAHAGNIKVTSAVCNPATGMYDVTYTLSWSNVPGGVTAPIYSRTDNDTAFDNGWTYPGGKTWTQRGTTNGAAGSIQWVESIPGTSKTGPWVYAYTPWSNGEQGGRSHDTRAENLAGNCGLTVTPTEPTWTDGACIALGQAATTGSATIPTADPTKIRYDFAIRNNANSPQGNQWTAATAGQVITANIGQWIHVRAVGINGYVLNGPTSSWKHEVDGSTNYECEQGVTPVKPTFSTPVCVAGNDSEGKVTIPSNVTGVQYSIRTLVSAPNNWSAWSNVTQGEVKSYNKGATIQVRATILAGYHIQGSWPAGWQPIDGSSQYIQYAFSGGPDAAKCVVPGTPTASQSVCNPTTTGASTAQYVIPTTANVVYRVNGAEKTAGSYPVGSLPATITVTAEPKPGFFFPAGTTTSFPLQFANPGACLDDATPVGPSFQDAVCTDPGTGVTSGYYVVNGTVGGHVVYEVKIGNGTWTLVTAATYGQKIPVSAGTIVEVRATAEAGYKLVGYTPWPAHTFTNAGACLDDATPAAPSFTDAVCTTPGTGVTSGYYVVNGTVNGHVIYEVKIGNGTWTVVDPATYGQQIPVAAGKVIEVRATAEAGYQLVGYTPWLPHTFADAGECLDDATPATPSFTDAVCTEPGTGTTSGYYVVNGAAGDHVVYEVKVGNGAWTVVDPATYGQKVSVSAGTIVEVRATAEAGYQLVGYTPWLPHTFANAGDCLDPVAVQPVVGDKQLCVIDDLNTGAAHYESGTITIPTTLHVTYSVNGVETGAGEHDFAPGTYTISAEAEAGYKLTNVPVPWTVKIDKAEPCGQLITKGTVTPTVSFKQTTCSASGSYTLGVDEVGNEAGVAWTVTGGLPNSLGTHKVTAPGKVVVTATPANGFGFSNSKLSQEWTFEFASLPADCLPTLALTGGSIAAGGLGLAAMLTLAGVLMVAARRRETFAAGQ